MVQPVLLVQLPLEQAGVISAPVARGIRLFRAGEAAHQTERFGQRCRALPLPLQELKASLHNVGLREAKGLAEVAEGGLAGVIQADRDGAHGLCCIALIIRRVEALPRPPLRAMRGPWAHCPCRARRMIGRISSQQRHGPSRLARSASWISMAAQWSLQDAKNRFSAVVEAALAGEPRKVTRLCRLDQASAPSLPELLLALPQDDEPSERIGLTPREFPCT